MRDLFLYKDYYCSKGMRSCVDYLLFETSWVERGILIFGAFLLLFIVLRIFWWMIKDANWLNW